MDYVPFKQVYYETSVLGVAGGVVLYTGHRQMPSRELESAIGRDAHGANCTYKRIRTLRL